MNNHVVVLRIQICFLQWAESLFRELDYRREARNGIRFKELYGDLEVCANSAFSLNLVTPFNFPGSTCLLTSCLECISASRSTAGE